jgi:peroxiredoxin
VSPVLAPLLAAVTSALTIGQAAPDFAATALDGTPVSLSDALASHRAVVVMFLSTVCPYANYFAEHIRDLDSEYRPKGVLFLGVNSNPFETAEEMIESARRNGYRFPYIRDADARIAELLGADRTPEAFLLDAEGKLRYHGWVRSKLLSPDLQRALDAVLAGKPVRLAETKSFGCAIERSKRAR